MSSGDLMAALRPRARRLSASDLAFIECAQEGDAGAFDYLILKHQLPLLQLVQQRARDPRQAEGIVRDAFRKAFRALGGFPRKLPFFTWLSRIALDTADLSPRWAAQSGQSPQPEVPEAEAPPALTDDVRQAVRATMARLPRELRTALELRETAGMSYEEIGAVMQCPARTVRSFVFLARAAIDERMRDVLVGHEPVPSAVAASD